jgi:chaperonin GroEL (HSP60 family)
LETPFHQIVRNHGVVHPPLALAEARFRGCRYGFDVTTGQYVDMRERGILDSLAVARGALRTATSAASSLLTTGVVVLPAEARREQRTRP